jgi:oligo-1,6-glucosidase
MGLLTGDLSQDRAWWREGTVYQIFIHSFKDSSGDGIGDLNGVTAKLDYLYQLGVDIIQLSPIYDSPLVDMGYDVRCHTKILDVYGTMDDWKKLLDEVHKRRMRLIMDLVLHHTSNEVNF